MYIKIGKTDIKYSSGVDDYMIFSEVPDSQLSYEKPILVRTKDELDIWFGRDFTDRNYFDELINRGLTLYLYKPIKENNTHDIDDYIDIESYYIFPEVFYTLPDKGESGYAYYLKMIPLENHYYTFGRLGNLYTWFPISEPLENYTIYPKEYFSIYDLPNIGDDRAYYVSNIPAERYWYIYDEENDKWREAGNDLDKYTPWRALFPNQDLLPKNSTYRYHVLFDDSWWMWKNDTWEEIKKDDEDGYSLQEFPIYFNKKSDLPLIGDYYKYYVVDDWYIWFGESWAPENIFPQNLDNISWSLNNRDTLIISKPDEENIHYTPYSYPEFRLYEENHLGVFSREYDLDLTKNHDIEDLDSINNGYKTMSMKLHYTEENLDDGYIIIKSQKPQDDNTEILHSYCFYSGDNEPNISAAYFYGERRRINTIYDLINAYIDLGYKCDKVGDNEYLVYSENLFTFTEFYTYQNITLESDFDDSYNIITKYIEGSKGIEFYSKTIGTAYTDSENNKESLIKVDIDKSEYEKYRIKISRYDYIEIYEGPLFTQIGEERLDNVINNKSKLVNCKITGLKNFIAQNTYVGEVDKDVRLENNDFELLFKTYTVHYYVPPVDEGELGYRYKVYDGLWKVWLGDRWEEITRVSDLYYELEEKILNYPNQESLFNTSGLFGFKYYVEDEDKWWIWKNDAWIELKDEVLPDSSYSIKINKIGYETYSMHFIVGDLSETYTGNLFDLQKELEDINLKFSSNILDYFRFKDLCNSLRTGTYYLRRGKNEKQTRDMYIKSLGCLFDTQVDNIFPDFFLVPDINKYIDKLNENESLYKEYRDIFLKHAIDFNCQFLIQNNSPKYKILNIKKDLKVDDFNDIEGKDKQPDILYEKISNGSVEYRILEGDDLVEFTDQETIEISRSGGDFIYNYTKDVSNYLVYFFKPLTLYKYPRPAYYVFLDGLLEDIYSMSETKINYDSPLNSDPYELDVEPLSQSLEKYKSNFLINNNHMYYYKKYFNGSEYKSTVWMRFVIGKIYRELQKNRWKYLSNKSIGLIKTEITNTLERIQNQFSIVSFINLVQFIPEMSKNYLELSINIYVNDLMNNNMTLDITVNYNELNTD